MIDFYQIRSPLSQITEEQTMRFIRALSDTLGEELCKVDLAKYLSDDFALLFVASGGSEGYFLEVFESLKKRHCYILTSGDSNSLAASMEILSYMNKNGGSAQILHGDIGQVAQQIRVLHGAHRALASLRGKKLGCIGAPSDWLIASTYSTEAMMEKLSLGFVSIPMEELLDEIRQESYVPNEYTSLFQAQAFDKDEIEKALYVYGAFQRLAEKYGLCGLTVRCFDLLNTVHTTGCEGDVPSLLSMAILGSITGEPMFMCNPSRFDTKEGSAVFAHCTIPTTMVKDFCLNTHFESGIGAAVQGSFEEGACTLFKCEGDLSRFYAQAGRIVPVPYSDMLCRTQIKVMLDDFSYFLTRPINNHHIICKGNHTAEINAFFQLLGLTNNQ